MAVEYTPLTLQEIEDLRQKEARGELTPEDTMRFIESTRAKFLSKPLKAPKAAGKSSTEPKKDSVEFF